MAAATISSPYQDSLKDLNARMEVNLLEVLAKSYGEGFVAAAKSLEAKPQVTKDDSRLLKEDVTRLAKPIQDYNQALAGKVEELVKKGFAEGKDYADVAKDLRTKIPEILNNEPITIQRPGKRPVAFTAEEYADLVANVVPYAVRNEAYVRGLKESGADGWQSVAVGDERMCPMCGEKHGQVYGWEDPKPPYHVGCRCRPIAFFRKRTKEEMAESERIKAKALEKPWDTPSLAEFAEITLEEKVAIENYAKNGYIEINSGLRKEDISGIKDSVELIDSVFSKSKGLSEEIIVYRGIDANAGSELYSNVGIREDYKKSYLRRKKIPQNKDILDGKLKAPDGGSFENYLSQKLAGRRYHDKGYMSTSKAFDEAFTDGSKNVFLNEPPVVLEIKVPKGSKVVDVDEVIGAIRKEQEVLLNRGSTLIIDGADYIEQTGGTYSASFRPIIMKIKAHLEPTYTPLLTKEEVADQLIDDILPKKMAYPGSKIERPKLERKTIDIHNSPVIQKATADEIAYMNGTASSGVIEKGDSKLKALAEEIGFTDRPIIVSESELDKIVAEGHRELWRGLNQNKPGEFTNLFRSGEYFAGEGIYGNGIYTGTGEGARNLASLYAPGEHGAVMRMAIDKDAKVITATELKDKLDTELKALKFDRSSEEAWAASKVKKEFMQDPGRAAVVWGYDAIDAENGQFIVLNRKAIYVQATDYSREDRAKW